MYEISHSCKTELRLDQYMTRLESMLWDYTIWCLFTGLPDWNEVNNPGKIWSNVNVRIWKRVVACKRPSGLTFLLRVWREHCGNGRRLSDPGEAAEEEEVTADVICDPAWAGGALLPGRYAADHLPERTSLGWAAVHRSRQEAGWVPAICTRDRTYTKRWSMISEIRNEHSVEKAGSDVTLSV